MKFLSRISILLAAIALFLMGSLPVSAQATTNKMTMNCTSDFSGPWLLEPDCTYNRSTIYAVGNSELRVGYYNGKQYGWARLTAYSPNQYVMFQISEDGGKTVANATTAYQQYNHRYTYGYPTSSSDSRRFRICYSSNGSTSVCGDWW